MPSTSRCPSLCRPLIRAVGVSSLAILPLAGIQTAGATPRNTSPTALQILSNSLVRGSSALRGRVARPTDASAISFAPAQGYNNGSVPDSDVSGDKKPDIVTANGSANSLSTLINRGSGAFGKTARISSAGIPAQQVALGDFNKDGKLDAASVSGGTVYVMIGEGTASSRLSKPWAPSPVDRWRTTYRSQTSTATENSTSS